MIHKLCLALVGLLLASPAGFAETPPLKALARLPVKEITVFKDGHAFVLHSGRMPTDAAGQVVLDYLPSPVIGTFWPNWRSCSGRPKYCTRFGLPTGLPCL